MKRTVSALLVSAAAVVATPATANAADAYVWSQSGNAYVWYNDAGNQIVSCDMRVGDGDGVITDAQAGISYLGGDVHYNNCVTIARNVPDGQRLRIATCDWVWKWWLSARDRSGCSERIITSS